MKKHGFLRMTPQEREALRKRLMERRLTPEDYETLSGVVDLYHALQWVAGHKVWDRGWWRRLARRLLGGMQ